MIEKGGYEMGCLVTIIVAIYFISPIDFWPGVLDDILAIVVAVLFCARSGVNPYKKQKNKTKSNYFTIIRTLDSSRVLFYLHWKGGTMDI